MPLQRMYPKTSHVCSFSQGQGYGTHTKAGTSTYVASGECATHVDDLYGALDEKYYAAARSLGAAPNNNGQFEWIFGDPPENITIASLTLVGWFRTSSANSAAIDTAPTVKFFVNPAGTRYYAASADTVNRPINRNTLAAAGTFAKWSRSWATNPATTVAWTRADLLSGNFKAGVASDGTYGSGIYPTTGGSSSSFDVASFYVELDTTPTGLYIDPIRQAISHQLRMLRRGLRVFTIEAPPEFCRLEPGDNVWSSHDLLPWGPGLLSWQQVPLYLMRIEEMLAQRRRRFTFLDLRDQFASFWSPLRITGVDAQNSGLAVIHRGGGWQTARAQVAYGQRPGDGLYQQVASNTPLLTKDGLLIQGGSDVNYLLNSTFSQGTGDTFTSWTKTTGGSATIAQDTADYLIDVSGFQRSAEFTTTGAAENCYITQTKASVAANAKLFIRTWYKNDSGADAFFLQIQRGVDSYYWSGTAWQAAGVNLFPTFASSITRYQTGQIDVGGSITDITVRMGFHSTTATGANNAHVYALELQLGTTFSWCRRDLLPTTTVAVTRTADQTTLNNEETWRIFSGSRGFFRLDYVPQWSHTDLADGQTIGILQHAVNGSASPAGHLVSYYRTDVSNGIWFWQAAQLATSGATLPVAGTAYTIAGRMTSAAEDEHGVTGQAFDLWVEGVKGTGTTGAAELTPVASACIALGVIWIEIPPITAYYADGHFRNLLIDSRCPTDAEMERI